MSCGQYHLSYWKDKCTGGDGCCSKRDNGQGNDDKDCDPVERKIAKMETMGLQ